MIKRTREASNILLRAWANWA